MKDSDFIISLTVSTGADDDTVNIPNPNNFGVVGGFFDGDSHIFFGDTFNDDNTNVGIVSMINFP